MGEELQQIRGAIEGAMNWSGGRAVMVTGSRMHSTACAQALLKLAVVEATLEALTAERNAARITRDTWKEANAEEREARDAAEARVVAAEWERDEARSMAASDLSMMEAYRTEAIISERRVEALTAALTEVEAELRARASLTNVSGQIEPPYTGTSLLSMADLMAAALAAVQVPAEPPRGGVSEPGSSAAADDSVNAEAVGERQGRQPGSLTSPAPAEPPREPEWLYCPECGAPLVLGHDCLAAPAEPPREEDVSDLKRGDRVRLDYRLALYHGTDRGRVHAIHPGTEDTVEVLLDSGVYICTDPERLTLLSSLAAAPSVSAEPPERKT
jgi:hypothetical protein